MAMHETNSILKYVVPAVLIMVLMLFLLSTCQRDKPQEEVSVQNIKNTAVIDNASESLNTLTAELSQTSEQISQIKKDNDKLRDQNQKLLEEINEKNDRAANVLQDQIVTLKQQFTAYLNNDQAQPHSAISEDSMITIDDLTAHDGKKALSWLQNTSLGTDKSSGSNDEKKASIPVYTIPANATSVQDRLMTALVGRIPVKGVVTDPYPFKIVVSDNNLAANGLRIPNLLQMIVSGYCEGDLNLLSVRGWITSLTFVFADGTISTTTSNDNDIGNFTKANSLGYLSDKYGNPFIRGRLISNAPTYLAGNIGLGLAQGAASAYAQSQVTNTSSFLGNTNQAVTGSPRKFVFGQALTTGTNETLEWWKDREQQSFDAIYVAPVDENGCFNEIAINFAKEIHIDYDPNGRKIAHAQNWHVTDHIQLD